MIDARGGIEERLLVQWRPHQDEGSMLELGFWLNVASILDKLKIISQE